MKRRLVLVVILATAGLSVLLLSLRPPFDQPIDWVVLGGRTYQPSEILSESPLIVRVEPPPPPRFETEPFGPELKLEGGPLPEPLPPEVTSADRSVFVGYFDDVPVFVIAGDFGAFSRFLDFVTDFKSDGVVCVVVGNEPRGNTQSCLDADGQLGAAGSGSHPDPETGELQSVFMVNLLPPGTSVVAFRADGKPLGWQRPVASSAFVALQGVAGISIRWQAFDADGNALSH